MYRCVVEIFECPSNRRANSIPFSRQTFVPHSWRAKYSTKSRGRPATSRSREYVRLRFGTVHVLSRPGTGEDRLRLDGSDSLRGARLILPIECAAASLSCGPFCAHAERSHWLFDQCQQLSRGRTHQGAPHTDGGRNKSVEILVMTGRRSPQFRLKSAPVHVDRHVFPAQRKPGFRATCGPTQISGDVPGRRRCDVSCCQTSRRHCR